MKSNISLGCILCFILLITIAVQIQKTAAADLPFNDGINESQITFLDSSNFHQAINATKHALVSGGQSNDLINLPPPQRLFLILNF
jgi:hypothetical protein